jgi:hypothetical protein
LRQFSWPISWQAECNGAARLAWEATDRRPKKTPSDDGIAMRTIVDLPDPERAQLDALCRERGLSRAEALRQALRLWLQQQRPSHSEVFGLWRDRPEDSVELQQVLRAQWSGR